VRPTRLRALAAGLACLALLAGTARADRRYFVETYTPYLAPAGEVELELWSASLRGQGDSTATAWENRAELEYAIADRLTGALYLNYVQEPGSAMRFDGPSVELIYALAERGRLPFDPALYFEVRANGDEVELEPKLLVGLRHGPIVAAANLIGEFETIHSGDEKGDTEKALRTTLGVSREFGAWFALGAEASYRRLFEDPAGNPSALFLGPTINLQADELQLAFGWHPQIWGDPRTAASLNLSDYSRSEFRLILGMEF
jgi:hypothetical protein